MAYILDSAVRRQVAQNFPAEDWDSILMALVNTPLPLLDRDSVEVVRVHLAVLHLSQGNLKAFENALKKATRDWRDTLIGADLAYDNWPEVLKKRGIKL